MKKEEKKMAIAEGEKDLCVICGIREATETLPCDLHANFCKPCFDDFMKKRAEENPPRPRDDPR